MNLNFGHMSRKEQNIATATVNINTQPLPAPAYPEPPPSINDLNNYIPTEFFTSLCKIQSKMLASDNRSLLANLFDLSGKIILHAEDLAHLIAIITKSDMSQINIRYQEQEATCLSKISPIKIITRITINNRDLEYTYNREFNIMQLEYNISLSRCSCNNQIQYG
jgi:hypothetical protein